MLSVCLCVCVALPLTFECLNQSLRNLVCISWQLSPSQMTYFINTSDQSMCLHVYLFLVATQRYGKNVSAETNTHAAIEELLDVSYERKVGDSFFPEFVVSFVVTFMGSSS
jgi:hypothetical protein